MAAYGFGYSRLTEQGYIGFLPTLSEGAWGSIGIPKELSAWELVTMPLAELSALLRWKLRLTWALQTMVMATGSDTDAAADADSAWDSVQRQFDLRTRLALESRDPAVVAAAKRVRAKLLAGAGTDQTTWERHKEVDFGRSQVVLAGQAPLDADIQLLGLGDLVVEIARTSESLASTIGHGGSADSAPVSRSTRVRRAQAACSAAFNAVHDDIEWTMSRQAPGAARDFLKALLTPLEALLERYTDVSPEPQDRPAGGAPAGGAPSAPAGGTQSSAPSKAASAPASETAGVQAVAIGENASGNPAPAGSTGRALDGDVETTQK